MATGDFIVMLKATVDQFRRRCGRFVRVPRKGSPSPGIRMPSMPGAGSNDISRLRQFGNSLG